MSITFQVPLRNGRPTRSMHPATLTFEESVKRVMGSEFEAGAANHQRLIHTNGEHPFMNAAFTAFAEHYPLKLTPEAVWLLLCQGVALHVDQNPEELRSKFVAHEGKMEIKVRRDDFVKGKAANPWEEVFPAFTEQIKEHMVGDAHSLITQGFSGTGPIEKAAFEVTLLSTVKHYFALTFQTMCGIPSFTLDGTPEDWVALRERAAKLAQFDLEWWTPHLLPTLDQFVEAAKGNPDIDWWGSFFNEGGGSGGPYISGHMLTLFPYRKTYRKTTERNTFEPAKMFGGWTTDSFPSSASVAPFVWEYFMQVFPMEFVAGFVGVGQNADLSLEPAIGWFVRDAKK